MLATFFAYPSAAIALRRFADRAVRGAALNKTGRARPMGEVRIAGLVRPPVRLPDTQRRGVGESVCARSSERALCGCSRKTPLSDDRALRSSASPARVCGRPADTDAARPEKNCEMGCPIGALVAPP
ncbi:hypothetical protein XCCB100_0574 [Xanthomonas campestris pv. campestris]|uniref:Uncharacterized protein n=1 Tax=Xanthomonas campestris pv. campestris (strain B100) TaxID=509169 RepID=B0RN74_XANCB|nr:hypothetical protein XCCB100_0574 [Xanthomonas campestris pv. campestris]